MPTPLSIAAGFTGLVSVAGSLQALIGATLLSRFRRGETAADDALRSIERTWPAITVLKPLHGDELLLDDALDSICLQEYPAFQIIFGVQSTQDTAIPVVERLKARHPNVDITLVVDDAEHGPNRKIGNLINMYGAAHHDIIVVSDSDIHVTPNYLKHVVSALEEPGTDLITTLYAGRPATGSLVQQLGACQINHNFLPGVMMSRLLGRQDCLGATMALTRQKLEAIGGLRALVDHVADDAELGRLIRQQGGDIAIAPTLTHTTVGEQSLTELLAHELRWGRTVKNVEPLGYGLSSIQLPLFWAIACVLFRPNTRLSWMILALTWFLRAISASMVDLATKCPLPAGIPFLPLRDWLSAAIMVGSARGSRVAWRGRTVHIARRTKNSAASGTTTQPGTNRSV